LLFLTDYSIYVNNPETQFAVYVTQAEVEVMRALSRRAGAEMGIPTLTGKESADMPRVKAAITTTQSDASP
jgi:hypothetical protein